MVPFLNVPSSGDDFTRRARMKRDLELVKRILLRVEARDHVEPSFSIPGYDDKTVSYHVAMMKEAGLLDAIVHKFMDGTLEGIPIRMTWQGHE